MLCEGQREAYSRLVGLESATFQAMSDLLVYQCHLSILQQDIRVTQIPRPVNQGQANRLQHPSAAPAVLPFSYLLSACFVAPTAASLPQDFATGDQTGETQ